MLTPQKVEWIEFITTNVTFLGNNVYPSYAEVNRTSDIFCIVEVFILESEPMITGTAYSGFARLTFVAPDPKTLDHELLDTFGDVLEIKHDQFVTLQFGGVANVSDTEPYIPEKEYLIKREVDIRMTWYNGT